MAKVLYANAYHTDRLYGGPEEGGWYYDVGSPVMSLPFICNDTEINEDDGNTITEYDSASRAAACLRVYELCVAAGVDVPEPMSMLKVNDWHVDWFKVYIESEPGQDFPKKRPHWDMGEDY